MEYRRLGKSGLKVSCVGFGSWLTFGVKTNIDTAKDCIRYAFEKGINFFDNAEVYGNGEAEVVMGIALKEFRREDVVLSTKIFFGGDKPNDIGLSRKHLIEGTKNSLKRLQVDYVDLLFCHRPDPNTTIEETVRAMDHLVRSGQALYWGTSEWSASEISEAYDLSYRLGCIPPSVEQPEYNILHRNRVEKEYSELYKKCGLGLTVWSPLASGILSGKYDDSIPTDSRLGCYPEWRRPDMEKRVIFAKQLSSVAKSLGVSLAQLSIAWCLKNKNVSSVILGASKKEQLVENIQATDCVEKLTPNVLKEIESTLEKNLLTA